MCVIAFVDFHLQNIEDGDNCEINSDNRNFTCIINWGLICQQNDSFTEARCVPITNNPNHVSQTIMSRFKFDM